jgi:hypothetical protein
MVLDVLDCNWTNQIWGSCIAKINPTRKKVPGDIQGESSQFGDHNMKELCNNHVYKGLRSDTTFTDLYLVGGAITIFKNISLWEGLSHILWRITDVSNQQPDIIRWNKFLRYIRSFAVAISMAYSCNPCMMHKTNHQCHM